MRIHYVLPNQKFTVQGKQDAAYLSDLDGFFFLPTVGDWSNYQGWHVAAGKAGSPPRKIVDFIGVARKQGKPSPDSMTVSFGKYVKRKTEEIEETYSLGKCQLNYSLKASTPQRVIAQFDVRNIFTFPERGRIFIIGENSRSLAQETLTLSYIQYADESLTRKEYACFIAVRAEGFSIVPLEEWSEKEYPFDARRNARSSAYVFSAFEFQPRPVLKNSHVLSDYAITLGYGESAEQAIAALDDLSSGSKMLVPDTLTDPFTPHQRKAFLLAAESFHALTGNTSSNQPAIHAGLPWFFQYWLRDELISLEGLAALQQNSPIKKILLRILASAKPGGVFPSFAPDEGVGSIDATGLLFFEMGKLLKANEDKKTLNLLFTPEELLMIYERLEAIEIAVEQSRSQGFLLIARPLETWMDTSFGPDARSGAGIELQALHLCMEETLIVLIKTLAAQTQDQAQKKRLFEGLAVHKEKLHTIKEDVRAKFNLGGVLADTISADGVPDLTQRSNVFLSYFFYPDLFNQDEWKAIFDHALAELWLDWGGLASISKNHPLFCSRYTGENNQSYHRGDSWLFVNHLAAYALLHVDPLAYFKPIAKILEASTKMLLMQGVVGSIAELSSASLFEPAGCPVQAWSIATYLRLLDAIKEDPSFQPVFEIAFESL